MFPATKKEVASAYRDQDEWTKKAILNVANMGKFSSDRTINAVCRTNLGGQAVCSCSRNSSRVNRLLIFS
jgi:hypothetical protein